MKRVLVTVGPQGAGKSTFCAQLMRQRPNMVMVSRDDILIKLFGTTWLDAYSGGHFTAYEQMYELVAAHLKNPNIELILDCWNGFPEEREDITQKLRELGAEQIVGMYFVTPEETCVAWRTKKEAGRQGLHKESYIHDYQLFHSMPVSRDQGFDEVIQIDPTQQTFLDLLFPLPEKQLTLNVE